MLNTFLEPILLIGAICLDNLIVSTLYSYQNIKISFKVIFIINFICAFSLFISQFLGNFIKTYINLNGIHYISFAILFILGIIKLFDSFIKNIINKYAIHKTKHFKMFNLNFIVQIYGDSTKADQDFSKSINVKEALALSISLSIDSLSVGIGYGLTQINYFVIIFSFIIGIVLFYIGKIIGQTVPKKYNHDISWISGIMLIILAFFKI